MENNELTLSYTLLRPSQMFDFSWKFWYTYEKNPNFLGRTRYKKLDIRLYEYPEKLNFQPWFVDSEQRFWADIERSALKIY